MSRVPSPKKGAPTPGAPPVDDDEVVAPLDELVDVELPVDPPVPFICTGGVQPATKVRPRERKIERLIKLPDYFGFDQETLNFSANSIACASASVA